METSYLLYGAGGHAKVIINCLNECGYKTLGIFDDNEQIINFYDLSVFHKYESEIFSNSKLIVSIGDNLIRKNVTFKVRHKYGIVIHPNASISKFSEIGVGSVIFQNAVIQPSVKVGKHCILNTGSIVEHDCEMSDFVHVSPGATICGGVSIGEGTHIGAGSVIIQNLSIGSWVTIGAGSTVIRDIPDFAVVVGNPAKIIKFNI